jgi:hypothetical protein
MMRPRSLAALVTMAGLSWASAAHAAAPGNWSIGVERIFGFSSLSVEEEQPSGQTQETSGTAFSLFADFDANLSYSPARLSLDYIADSGISLGGALGYGTFSGDLGDADLWLFAPRLGYFARPGAQVGLWPRAGITHVVADSGAVEVTATAITLEVPLVLLFGGPLAICITPHADVGIAGGTNAVDRTVTEIGLQFGLATFF